MSVPVGELNTDYRQPFINGKFVVPSGGLEDAISPVTEARIAMLR